MKKNPAAVILSVLFLSSVPIFADVPAGSLSSATHLEEPVRTPGSRVRGDVLPVRQSFYDVWIRDRLSVGLGFSVSKLTNNHRPQDRDAHKTFVGYVNKLEDERVVRFTADVSYWTARYLRLGVAYEQAGGRTRNYNNHRSDGLLEIVGPLLYLDIVYPCLDDTLLPHVGGGVFFGFSDFKEDDWWSLGYFSPAEYEATGRTNKTRNNRYREIRVDDTVGFLVQGGIAWRPVEHLQIDLTLRQTFMTCDAEFGYRGTHGFRREMTGEFDLDNFAVILMASYVF